MTCAATSSVVHELVERAGAASGREQALAEVFSVLQREVGFDCASAVCRSDRQSAHVPPGAP